ncbi:hypothetical protein E0I26_14605 [Flavobacterium rhamnosiphilum]|uniref:Uncharacterized protein n=1 Tax=Flavobacterium rhamnosiphilum TaxID=2541724 RepID=A0A4R5F4K4_9FLAO|nr:hypothetical protein E0I26_14605 [Flavobacterium rhamnosiphilum]
MPKRGIQIIIPIQKNKTARKSILFFLNLIVISTIKVAKK